MTTMINMPEEERFKVSKAIQKPIVTIATDRATLGFFIEIIVPEGSLKVNFPYDEVLIDAYIKSLQTVKDNYKHANT